MVTPNNNNPKDQDKLPDWTGDIPTSPGLDIYEDCKHWRRTKAPAVLDDLLEINFIHAPTRKVLKRARFYVTADASTSGWICNHPTFKNGVWPLGLMALHQWFWKIKFIDVDVFKSVKGGAHDPNVGTTFITAEFEDFDHDGWFVPLVNFANTHLIDQLKAFYEEDPTAFPSQERISYVKQVEMDKIAAKHQKNALEQLKRRRFIKESVNKVRVFIDESGDAGFNNVQDLYVFSPVTVPEHRYLHVVAELKALIPKHWGANAPAEIHMTEVPESKKDTIKNEFARIILENDIQIICYSMVKWPFIKHLFRRHAEAKFLEEMPLEITWHDLVNDKEYFLQSNFLSLTIEQVVSDLAIDFLVNGIAADIYHDRKYKIWMNESLHRGFRMGIEAAKKNAEGFFGLSILPKVAFAIADSEREPCLWLSDWISGELRAWAFHKEFSSPMNKAKANMLFVGFDEFGVKRSARDIGVVAEDAYPDLPRLIVRGNPRSTESTEQRERQK